MLQTYPITHWSHTIAQLRADFPELTKIALPNTVNTLSDVAIYLAQAHDLTVSEATQALEDWHLTYMSVTNLTRAA